MNTDNEDFNKQLFASECMRLDAFVRMYCSTGFTDREITAALGSILKEVLHRQENKEAALEQFIEFMKKDFE